MSREIKLWALWTAFRLLKQAGLSTKAISVLIAQVAKE